MRLYNNAHKKEGNFNGAIQIQPLESTLVVLGYGAIYINFLFNLFLLGLFVTKTKHKLCFLPLGNKAFKQTKP